jgi:hypothetical protein
MRIYKTKRFQGWAKQVNLTDVDLKKAINELLAGLHDTNLGGNLYKKRVALKGKGKSGGARTIIACKLDDKAFFLYGFAKNKRANITQEELIEYKKFAKILFAYKQKQIDYAVKQKILIEVNDE